MTNSRSSQLFIALAIGTFVVIGSTAPTAQITTDVVAEIDHVFAKWTTSTPGCAVGVSVKGQTTAAKAYGMADLEHQIKNTAETIFEAGSVSKQFTAAAVLLLAQEGKLSLDDPARKYVPELPDYGVALTIRQMLTHTSGLRDWGNVAGIAGWPRGSRVHTHAHVLDIVNRQRALNFTPGTRWSYTNTGYNLAAIIVARVSGMSFAEFTRRRIFEPLQMIHTSWRDDHTRIVSGRAIAYSEERDGFHIEMPFENVHGNGGLLTTVGDLLRWNENFVSAKVGGQSFVNDEQEPGRFSDGRAHGYAFGLGIGAYKGLREISHSGATAGYRADLVRYPDQHLSVAVLCNVTSGAATTYSRAVADMYLTKWLKPAVPPQSARVLTSAQIDAVAGLYRNKLTGMPLTLVRDRETLRIDQGPTLVSMSESRFVTANGQTWDFEINGGARLTDPFGSVDVYERVSPAKPSVEELKVFTGTYVSEEAEATIAVTINGTSLVFKRRPDTMLPLTPIYADAFRAPQLGTVIFRRDDGGRVTTFSVVQDRVWDLRFAKQPEPKVPGSQN